MTYDFSYRAERLSEQQQGIGEVAARTIRDGMTNAAVLDEIRRAYPLAKTSVASLSWYRVALRSVGEVVPTGRALRPLADRVRRADRKPTDRTDTIAWVAQVAIREGATDEEAVEAVLAVFPRARTKPASIVFYRTKMRNAGETVPTSAEASNARAKATLDRPS